MTRGWQQGVLPSMEDMVEEDRREAAADRFFAVIGRSTAAFLVIAIVLEIFSFAALSVYRRLHMDPLSPQKSPAYDSETWGADFWREQSAFWSRARSNYLPFMVWSVRKWHGKYINTDDSEMGTWRRTIQAMSDDCKRTTVRKLWVFGGSTVYGIGTPDWATIPSFLSQKLNADHAACWEVTNLGSEGYVTNQEVTLLIQQLKAGRRPDIAIFYDGVNESLVGGFSPGDPTEHWTFDAIKARFEKPETGRLSFLKRSYTVQFVQALRQSDGQDHYPTFSDEQVAAKARTTLENYEANVRIARMLAKEYGFKTYFFWQPLLEFGNKPLVPFEEKLKEARRTELGGRVQRGVMAVYNEAERQSRISQDYLFLGHALDDVKDLIYVDEFHLDPRGNHIMADRIAETLRANGSVQ
jgi:lysophospholipase L1-like esterase